jgi:hypothetical protein
VLLKIEEEEGREGTIIHSRNNEHESTSRGIEQTIDEWERVGELFT